MEESMNCMGSVEGETASCIETCAMCAGEVSIKVEEAVDIKDEIPEALTFSPMKTEHENSVDLGETVPSVCSETGLTVSADGSEVRDIRAEEVLHTQEEDCLAVALPAVTAADKNGVDLGETVPSVCSETGLTVSVDGSEVSDIRAELVLHTQEEDRLAVAALAVKGTDKNCMGSVEGETAACGETCVICGEEVSIKVEEAVDIKDEIPEAVTFSPMKTEHENGVDLGETVPFVCSETHLTVSADGSEVSDMRAEEVLHTQEEEEDRLAVALGAVPAADKNSVDLGETVPSVCSETGLTVSVDGSEVCDIRAEEVLHTQEEDRLAVAALAVKGTDKNCMGSVEGETASCIETCAICAGEVSIKVEEAVDIKDEIPEALTFSPMKTEHENGVDLGETVPSVCSETGLTVSVDGSEVSDVRAEEVLHTQEEEEHLAVALEAVTAADKNGVDLGETVPSVCSETGLTVLVDGSEVSDMRAEEVLQTQEEEDRLAVGAPAVKATDKGILNEELQVHSAECRYSCDLHRVVRPYICAVCAVCDTAFSEKRIFLNVDRIDIGECPYACAVCKTAFSNHSNLISHLHIHSRERPQNCDVCMKAFSSKGNLVKHQRIHSGERPYVCKVCNKGFIQLGTLIKHQRIHRGERPYNCDVCTKAFSSKSSLEEHQHIHSGERPYYCSVCNKGFSQRSNLIVHLRIHSGERPFICKVCNKGFIQSGTLIKHQRIHTGERPYNCDVCTKAFSSKSSLEEHQHIHSGERPYYCSVCNKCFSQQSSLLVHLRIHSGERPYICNVCNKGFSQRSSLVLHERIHSGERPYACSVCNKQFIHHGTMIRHQRIHSGERPYNCDVCNKVFSAKSTLIIHQRIHSGERPYACALCNKGFSRRSNLVAHQRIHTGDRPYICDVCNKGFSQQGTLTTHQHIHRDGHT